MEGLEEEDRGRNGYGYGGGYNAGGHGGYNGAGSGRDRDRRKLEVFVGGLNFTTSEVELREFFRRKGVQVVSLRVIKDPSTGTSKGIAFAELPDETDYRAALALDGVRF